MEAVRQSREAKSDQSLEVSHYFASVVLVVSCIDVRLLPELELEAILLACKTIIAIVVVNSIA